MKGSDWIQELTTSIIAIIVIGGYLGLFAYDSVHGSAFQEPPGLGILVGAVAGTYFGKVLAVNGARQAGTAAAQTAVAANTAAMAAAAAAGTPPPPATSIGVPPQ